MRGAPPRALSVASVSAAGGLPWSSGSTYLPSSAEEKGKGALQAEGERPVLPSEGPPPSPSAAPRHLEQIPL